MSTLSVNTATASSVQSDASKATTALTKISPALAKAHERILAQAQLASTSISQLGQYKAAVSNLSVKANALGSITSSTSSADVIKTVENFVSAFNATITQTNAVAGEQANGQTEASRALAASKRTLSSTDASRSQLNKLGLTRQQDGTLALDSAVLQKALAGGLDTATATLSQLGKTMGKRADAELASSGSLNVASERSSQRALALKQQQSALLSAATTMSQAQANNANWATKQALQKYSSS